MGRVIKTTAVLLLTALVIALLLFANHTATQQQSAEAAYAKSLETDFNMGLSASQSLACSLQTGTPAELPAGSFAIYDKHGALSASLCGWAPDSVRNTTAYTRILGHMQDASMAELSQTGTPVWIFLVKIPTKDMRRPMSGLLRAEIPINNTVVQEAAAYQKALLLLDPDGSVLNLTDASLEPNNTAYTQLAKKLNNATLPQTGSVIQQNGMLTQWICLRNQSRALLIQKIQK